MKLLNYPFLPPDSRRKNCTEWSVETLDLNSNVCVVFVLFSSSFILVNVFFLATPTVAVFYMLWSRVLQDTPHSFLYLCILMFIINDGFLSKRSFSPVMVYLFPNKAQ